MTGIVRIFRCPDCASKVRVASGDDIPNFCPHCGSFVGDDSDKPEVAAPMIGTALGKSGDQVYRQLEASSGITNLKDGLREGDVAGVPVKNTVTEFAETAKKEMGFDYWQGGVGTYVSDAAAGARQGTGQKALTAIQGGREPSIASAPKLKSSWGGAG